EEFGESRQARRTHTLTQPLTVRAGGPSARRPLRARSAVRAGAPGREPSTPRNPSPDPAASSHSGFRASAGPGTRGLASTRSAVIRSGPRQARATLGSPRRWDHGMTLMLTVFEA